MKASAQYNDFVGTSAADISDHLGGIGSDDFKAIASHFELDEARFKLVGISIYGTNEPSVSLICVDLSKSTEEKEHIVRIHTGSEAGRELLDILFKRLHIVLYEKFDDHYPDMEYSEEYDLSDIQENE